MSEDPDAVVEHRPDRCACCGGGLHGDLPAEVVSLSERMELPEVAPVVTQHRRLAVQCPTCGARVIAPVPEAARGTPFGPRLHAVAIYLKTFQALSCERLQSALAAAAAADHIVRRVDERALDLLLAPMAKGDGTRTTTEVGIRVDGRDALPHPFASKEAARAAAASVAQAWQANAGKGMFTTHGLPEAVSGVPVKCEGYGSPIDEPEWLASTVTHDVVPNFGWNTTVGTEVGKY